MSLFKRDKSGLSRGRRARRLRDRARMQLACSARFMIEELESRVLLNASPVERTPTFFTVALPPGTAAHSTLAQPSFAIRPAPITAGGFITGGPESGSSGLGFVHSQLAVRPDPPTLIVVGPPLPDWDLPTSLVVASESSPPLDGGQLPPLLVTSGTDRSGAVGSPTTAAGDRASSSAAPVPLNGTGWVNVASSAPVDSAPHATPLGDADSPILPDTSRVDVTGTLSPDKTMMSFEIPVGPRTQALGLDVRETDGDSNNMPVFGQMALLDPTGTTMAEFGPPSVPGPSAAPGHDGAIAERDERLPYLDSGHDRRAHVGGQLVVRNAIGNHGGPGPGVKQQYLVRSGRPATRSLQSRSRYRVIGEGPGIGRDLGRRANNARRIIDFYVDVECGVRGRR